mmetsp:Transcript_30371/g.53374  ORF Transcript_30371/g.53374 Transcript_30371/m.53374 type:complete len:204 (-) Transcript_30371:327-938(-)
MSSFVRCFCKGIRHDGRQDGLRFKEIPRHLVRGRIDEKRLRRRRPGGLPLHPRNVRHGQEAEPDTGQHVLCSRESGWQSERDNGRGEVHGDVRDAWRARHDERNFPGVVQAPVPRRAVHSGRTLRHHRHGLQNLRHRARIQGQVVRADLLSQAQAGQDVHTKRQEQAEVEGLRCGGNQRHASGLRQQDGRKDDGKDDAGQDGE